MSRERKVDISAMSVEQVDLIAQNLGVKVNEILLKAKDEAEKYLKVYGLALDLSYNIQSSEQQPNQ